MPHFESMDNLVDHQDRQPFSEIEGRARAGDAWFKESDRRGEARGIPPRSQKPQIRQPNDAPGF